METLDLRGKPCPIPVIEVKKKLASMAPGALLEVFVDNDIARQNLQRLAEGQGHGFAGGTTPEGYVRLTLTVGEGCRLIDTDDGKGLVVAVGSDRMGRGDDDLGRTLMKSFIFSLTELTPPPEHILFFNGGVHLTCEGSSALDDLQALADKGVVVNSCGACLDFYKKSGLLKVGGATNMMTIVETMAQAKRLVQL